MFIKCLIWMICLTSETSTNLIRPTDQTFLINKLEIGSDIFLANRYFCKYSGHLSRAFVSTS